MVIKDDNKESSESTNSKDKTEENKDSNSPED